MTLITFSSLEYILNKRSFVIYHLDVFPLQIFLTVVLFLPQSQELLLLLVSQLLQALVFLAH